ncbi:ArnT family glycosyltransferase [Occallatibacter riparius]|uniref:Glycosyltransferase family 39 protein n=1 Tax=Occallatibacter riparius TaxID=1002689 RepID=A0A9J7BNE0_9BACT|nr:glycosyltransferase family 39 protein [Occallatibacter riparius]UWZ84235.1 glycosyltransferase family 39 protein [Occallatibacter riparius]
MNDNRIARREALAVLACCVTASVVACAWSWQQDALLNYGDAEAHLHIARRVLDSHRPGLTQLGSVWLPLPHLLMIPFVACFDWWRNGLAGLIPSSLVWLASCWGIYKLARRWLRPAPAAIALAFFALNPNLLYLQTTAMTEPLFVCEMVWTVLLLVEWSAALDAADHRRSTRLLWPIALILAAAVFTRYDGWIMALLAWTAIGIVLLRRSKLRSGVFWIATVIVVAAPLVWFAYNQIVFGDWLDFARGPYSAKAIEMRTATPGDGPPHPGWHNMWVSLIFYVKAAEMVAFAEQWGNLLLVISILGTTWGWLIARRKAFAWALLLWLPFPFYAYSVAYGSVPIFLPVWWPHSFYNTRYGLEMIPAFALGAGFAANLLLTALGEFAPRSRRAVTAILFVLIGLNLGIMLRHRPLVYVEGTKNATARRPYEREIASALRAQLAKRPDAIVLTDTSVYPHIVALSGIPLRQTINESDKEFYQAALQAPAQHAALVLVLEGGQIEKAVHDHPAGLVVIGRFSAPYQPAVTLYASDTSRSIDARGAPEAVVASAKEKLP